MDETRADVVRQGLKSAAELYKALEEFLNEEGTKKVLEEKAGTSLELVNGNKSIKFGQHTYINTTLDIDIVKANLWSPSPEPVLSFEVLSYRTFRLKKCEPGLKECVRTVLLSFCKKYDALYFV
jgi:hypothetical protein